MTSTVGIAAAFWAGTVSFLSPCVLPLVPTYVSFMTGMSLTELTEQRSRRPGDLVPIALFVVGFTTVFVALGAGASVVGGLLSANRQLLTRIGGIVLVALGAVLLDVVPLPAMRGINIDPARLRRFGRLTAFALGLVFPLALGPCAGPVYGAILTLAADSRSVAAGSVLLLAYSAGLAVPFVLVALTLHRAAGTLKWLAARARAVRVVTGVLVIALGSAMATGVLDRVTAWMHALPIFGWAL
jgi:cytochrome c-type biogenesis protein